MKPRISYFKICTCGSSSLKMTQKGILDARNASLNNHTKALKLENARAVSKQQAEAALDWLLNANSKSPKFVMPC